MCGPVDQGFFRSDWKKKISHDSEPTWKQLFWCEKVKQGENIDRVDKSQVWQQVLHVNKQKKIHHV